MWQNVMNFVSKTSNKGSPQIQTSKLIKVAHQIRKQTWEKIPKLIIVRATTIGQVRVQSWVKNEYLTLSIGEAIAEFSNLISQNTES